MPHSKWPSHVDMSEDEARRSLRGLELNAYSSIVSVFRAQGDLTPQKKHILSQLQTMLGINYDRHKAEVRKSVNNEKLSTIALHLVGVNHNSEWIVEGLRPIQRECRAPFTEYTSIANTIGKEQAERNSALCMPHQTGDKDKFLAPPVANTMSSVTLASPIVNQSITTPTVISQSAPVSKHTGRQSPTTNVVMLPSGTSIHIKGGLNIDDDEDVTGAKRRRIASSDIPSVSINKATAVTAVSKSSIAPMKITLSKPSNANTPAQKVILVSSPGQTVSTSVLSRKTSTVPIVKSVTPLSSHTRTSVVYPAGTAAANALNQSNDASSHSIQTVHTQQGVVIQRPRTKTTITASPRITTAKVSSSVTISRPGLVIPVGSSTNQTAKVLTATSSTSGGKPGIHIKQEGAMKIITSNGSKLLPRPSSTSMINTPIVVVTSASHQPISSTLPRNTIISNTNTGSAGTVAISSGKVISINTGKVITGVATTSQSQQALPHSIRTPVKLTASTSDTKILKQVTNSPTSGNVVVLQHAEAKPAHGLSVNEDKDFITFTTHKSVSDSIQQSRNLTSNTITVTTCRPSIVHKAADLSKSSILAGLMNPGDRNAGNRTEALSSNLPSVSTTIVGRDKTSDASLSTSANTGPVNVEEDTTSNKSAPLMDIFSSALAEAQINLDPYEFIDEEEIEDEEVEQSKDSHIPTTVPYDESLQLWADNPDIPTVVSKVTRPPIATRLPTSIMGPVPEQVPIVIAQSSSFLTSQTSIVSSASSVHTSSTPTSHIILPKGKELLRIIPAAISTSAGNIRIPDKAEIIPSTVKCVAQLPRDPKADQGLIPLTVLERNPVSTSDDRDLSLTICTLSSSKGSTTSRSSLLFSIDSKAQTKPVTTTLASDSVLSSADMIPSSVLSQSACDTADKEPSRPSSILQAPSADSSSISAEDSNDISLQAMPHDNISSQSMTQSGVSTEQRSSGENRNPIDKHSETTSVTPKAEAYTADAEINDVTQSPEIDDSATLEGDHNQRGDVVEILDDNLTCTSPVDHQQVLATEEIIKNDTSNAQVETVASQLPASDANLNDLGPTDTEAHIIEPTQSEPFKEDSFPLQTDITEQGVNTQQDSQVKEDELKDESPQPCSATGAELEENSEPQPTEKPFTDLHEEGSLAKSAEPLEEKVENPDEQNTDSEAGLQTEDAQSVSVPIDAAGDSETLKEGVSIDTGQKLSDEPSEHTELKDVFTQSSELSPPVSIPATASESSMPVDQPVPAEISHSVIDKELQTPASVPSATKSSANSDDKSNPVESTVDTSIAPLVEVDNPQNEPPVSSSSFIQTDSQPFSSDSIASDMASAHKTSSASTMQHDRTEQCNGPTAFHEEESQDQTEGQFISKGDENMRILSDPTDLSSTDLDSDNIDSQQAEPISTDLFADNTAVADEKSDASLVADEPKEDSSNDIASNDSLHSNVKEQHEDLINGTNDIAIAAQLSKDEDQTNDNPLSPQNHATPSADRSIEEGSGIEEDQQLDRLSVITDQPYKEDNPVTQHSPDKTAAVLTNMDLSPKSMPNRSTASKNQFVKVYQSRLSRRSLSNSGSSRNSTERKCTDYNELHSSYRSDSKDITSNNNLNKQTTPNCKSISPLSQRTLLSDNATNNTDSILPNLDSVHSSTRSNSQNESTQLSPNKKATKSPVVVLKKTEQDCSAVNGVDKSPSYEVKEIQLERPTSDNSMTSPLAFSDNHTGSQDEGSGSDDDDSNAEINATSNPTPRPKGRKRKRKSDQPLWLKSATGLLKRVMMYRGPNRNKGEHGAAAWFLRPVTDDEAPGYSAVISNPMDLGTIKKKLESKQYASLSEFESDMMLIYTNCCTYNPPEHNVRRDCEQVFLYFKQEYEKLLNKLSQAAEQKKIRLSSDGGMS